MVTQEKIDSMIKNIKYIRNNIKWSNIDPNSKYQRFKVNVISEDGDSFNFTGLLNPSKRTIASLALVYNRQFPLVRIDKKHHKNPAMVNSLEFNDWHKHKYHYIWEEDVAEDVKHEFNDLMSPGEIIEQFKIENNMRFLEGKSYQRLLFEKF